MAVTKLSDVAPAGDIKEQLKTLAKEKGADLFGVASAATIDSLAEQLRQIRKDEKVFSVFDKNPRMMPFDPVVTEHKRNIQGATDLLKDANRCDWATKFSLVTEEGNMYTGNYTDVPCPDKVTEENLADALRQMDPVLKFRPVTGEKCVVNCPLRG